MRIYLQRSLRNINDPWMASVILHGALAILISLLFLRNPFRGHHEVEIEVIESPQLAPQAIQVAQPQVQPKKAVKHEVFGANRKSVTSTQGETVKAGNTLAKTPDQEKLKADDPNSLPIPSEDYLITKMPELKVENRVPYPAEAKKKGIQGAVMMDLLIDASGKVREVTLVDGPDPDLNQAAVIAVKNFQFSPASIQDKPVAVRIRYSYRFVLEH